MHGRLALLATAALALGAAGAGTAASAGARPAPEQAVVRAYEAQHGQIGRRAWVAAAVPAAATPRAACAAGSRPETSWQGRVPLSDYQNGRAAKGYTCNATTLSREGIGGGFQVHRYLDRHGHECAYYDGTALFPSRELAGEPSGVVVLDMTNPRRPRRTAVLDTFAMRTPHESLRLNAKRGLLAAVSGSPFTHIGVIDVYDVSRDCRAPVLQSSVPLGVLGHEGAFSPDGRTYWVGTTGAYGLTAIDLTDPTLPRVVWRGLTLLAHGLSISDDGRRAYIADVTSERTPVQNWISQITVGGGGLRIVDVSQVQNRVASPEVRELGYVTWPEATIPQSTIPVTIKGKRYVVAFDEFDTNVLSYDPDENVGGVRLIDISDETRPRVVSRIRLAVWERAQRARQGDDPGASSAARGYAAHYCSVPQRREPGILACSAIVSGLRVFDIRDPLRPREVAYANHPRVDTPPPPQGQGGYAMAAPAFAPSRREVWYSDINTGFWAERLSPAAWPRPVGR